MRTNVSSILGRVVAIIAGLLLVGLILRLIVAILEPVLPEQFMHDIDAGWNMLYGIVSPAMPPIMAVGIVCALCWIIIGRR